jgi:hypothetical protein
MHDLPAPVAALIAAANHHDTASFLACFPEHGVVDDCGRSSAGTTPSGQ